MFLFSVIDIFLLLVRKLNVQCATFRVSGETFNSAFNILAKGVNNSKMSINRWHLRKFSFFLHFFDNGLN